MEEAVRSGNWSADGRLAAADDAALVTACAQQEPGAFQELLSRYRRPAITLAYQMLGNLEDAEDVAQEAFVRVFQAIPRFRRQAAFSTWLYRIVTNLCLGSRRRRKVTVTLESVREPRSADSPARSVTQVLMTRQVLEAMSPELRVILLLRDQEGLSYSEIAEALRLPMGTVRSRLSKARRSFRQIWNGLSEGGEEQS
ncbi:MAG TPA: sigma-70 family RNA polymerase sigma factor [Armatimonadota bacterium]|nr:sigma-70 family RNA polymerase sigma factor [Armatimonadota bacterium]